MLRSVVALIFAALASQAIAQSAILQGGPWAAGRAPMYADSGNSQPVLLDSGPASGGSLGTGLNELGLQVRGLTTPPIANGGTGPNGENFCDYDAPTDNATGYHYLCLSPNAQGGGLLSYGAGGGADVLPFNVLVNGETIPITAGSGTVIGPTTSTIPDVVCWNSTIGVLISDCGAPAFKGSSSGSTILKAVAAASGTLTLPAATDTLVGRATTDTLTNKTISATLNTLINLSPSGSVNVLSYATCNGTGDDTSNFNAALLAAHNANKALYVPNGATCMLSTPHAIYDNQTIYGDGDSSVLKLVANAAAFQQILTPGNGSIIANLQLDGNAANETNQSQNIYFSGVGNVTIADVSSNNMLGSVGNPAIRIRDTTDGANGTFSRIINFSSHGTTDGSYGVLIDGPTSNLILSGITSYGNRIGIEATVGAGTANSINNVAISNSVIDCTGSTNSTGLSITGFFSQSPVPVTVSSNVNVSDVIVRNCNGNAYGLVLEANNSIFNNIQTYNIQAVLANPINSVISNSIFDCNQTTDTTTICVDAGGSYGLSFIGNRISPIAHSTPDAGTGINIGAAVNISIIANQIVVTGSAIAGGQYDAGGGFAFSTLGANATIEDNTIDCGGDSNCRGIAIGDGYSGLTLSGNSVQNGSQAKEAYRLIAKNIRLLDNNVWGTQKGSCQVASATVVLLPDWCSSLELSGTTTVTDIRTNGQNDYMGHVAWVDITTPGTYVSAPTVTFTGGGCSPEPVATSVLNPTGGLGQITLSGLGTGCTSAPSVSFSGGGGGVATAQFQLPDEINGRLLTVLSNGALTITHTGSTVLGSITTRSGSNISASAGQVFQFYNGPQGTGIWTQPQ